MSYRDLLGADLYERIHAALLDAFPDPGAAIDDAGLDAVAAELLRTSSVEELRAAFGMAPQALSVVESLALRERPDVAVPIRYYRVAAMHERLDRPRHRFVGHLVAVRFALPERGAETIETDLGQCLAADRLLPSLERARVMLSRSAAYRRGAIVLPKRIDIITPPRTAHGRFAAIAGYLCYAEPDDPAPAYYVLEAGLATGQPKNLFVSTGLEEPILEPTGYEPTPFTSPDYWYLGHLTVDAAGEVRALRVDAKKTRQGPPHLRVRVRYTPALSSELGYHPLSLLLEAASRIARIATFRPGEADLGFFGPFAVLASTMLPWEVEPHAVEHDERVSPLGGMAEEAVAPDPRDRIAELVASRPQPGDDAWNELLALHAEHPELVDAVIAGEPVAIEEARRPPVNWAWQPVEPAPMGEETPASASEVRDRVQNAIELGHEVRAVGRRYSDAGALGTRGIQLSTRRLTLDDGRSVRRYPSGVLTGAARPRAARLIEVAASARVHDVNVFLAREGLALPMTGAFSGQTLIGAMQTSTHGTGLLHAPLCDLVRSMEIAVAQEGGAEVWRVERPGDRITDPERSPVPLRGVDAREADWFDALLVSFGSMAVITSVVIEVVDAFRLQQSRFSNTWSWLKSYLELAPGSTGHAVTNPRFYGFGALINPYSGAAHGDQECVVTELMKLGSMVPADILQKPLEGGAPHGASLAPSFLQLCVHEKSQIASALRAHAMKPPPPGVAERGYNDSWKLLTGPNDYPYGISIEYAYPLTTYIDALDAILQELRRLYTEDACVLGPVSLRFMKESRAMLGLSEGGNRATVEVLGALGARGKPLFRCDEALDALSRVAFDPRFDGRPHWGQRPPRAPARVLARYPRANEWNAVRATLDPRGVFGSRVDESVIVSASTVRAEPARRTAALESTSDPWSRLEAEVLSKLRAVERHSDVMSAPADRLVALFQSWVAEEQAAPMTRPAAPGGLEAVLDEKDWLGWATSFFTWAGNLVAPHAFLPPAEEPLPIPDHCRVALLGDWGSGLYGAPVCAASIQAARDPFHLVMHLGDVYYSGTMKEVRSRFLNLWPRVRGARSVALNSNHEMYSGGHGYFRLTLPAFQQPSSAVALRNERWLLLGLDTGYAEHDLAFDQAAWVARQIERAGSRRVVLFSHHQPFSLFEDEGTKLTARLAPWLDAGRIFAWYWGHEHRAVIYDRTNGLYGRCIGHSGFPYFRDQFENGEVVEVRGDDRWVRVKKDGVPAGLVLDGPNLHVPGYEDLYGTHGWCSLELRDDALLERVHRADGAVLYEAALK